LASPRPGTATIAVKSKGGIYVIIEPDTNHGGLWRKQVDPRHTIRTGRVHISIMCGVEIELKRVEMQRVIEEDMLGTSGQSRRLPRTNLTRAVVRQFACMKGTQHASVIFDAIVTICLIFPRVTFDPVMFQKHQFGRRRASRGEGHCIFFVTEVMEIFPHKVDQIDVGERAAMSGSINSYDRHGHANIFIRNHIVIQIPLRVTGTH